MKNNLKILLYLFLASLAACHPDRPLTRELGVASSVIEEQPDTALYILQRIPEINKLSPEDYALYCLLRTQAEYGNNIRQTSDSMISVAVDYFKTSSDSLLKAKSYYYLARVNEDMNNDSLAEQHFLTSLSVIEKTDEYKQTGQICNSLSELYYRSARHDEAFEMQKRAYANFLLIEKEKTPAPYYLIGIAVLLISILLGIIYRYSFRCKTGEKQIGKQKRQLNAARQTIADQKLELIALKKDISTMQKSIYNSSEIIRKVRAINEQRYMPKEKPSITEQEWNILLGIMEDTYNFVSLLKQSYPKMTDDDIRICALLKEGVNTTHICSVMGMTPETLTRRMQRIKSEKMGLGEQKVSLEMIIRSI